MKNLVICVMVAVLLAACDSSTSDRRPAAKGPPLAKDDNAVAACAERVTPVDPEWRKVSKVAGPLGFYGPGRHLKDLNRPTDDSDFVVKVPVIVEAQESVTISVAPEDVDRVGLVYRRAVFRARQVEDADSSVTFKPCSGERRTAWAGGFVLEDEEPIHLEVATAGTDDIRTVILGQ